MKTYSEHELKIAVAKSFSYQEVMRSLGLSISGKGHKKIKSEIENLQISTAHFKRVERKPYLLEDILIKDSPYQNSHSLKKRLISEGLLQEKCDRCNLLTWQGEKLSLHLDHINGDHSDNRLINLRLLCPNCHSLTPTWGTKRLKHEPSFCVDCNCKINRRSTRCRKCSNRHKAKQHKTKPDKFKIKWPPVKELCIMVENSNYTKVAKTLGVSDNAVRKHIAKFKQSE